jgi:hypothetical protein
MSDQTDMPPLIEIDGQRLVRLGSVDDELAELP